MPQLSVIVPVRNEAAHIRQTLEGLLAQDWPQEEYEILVVDGSSEDRTLDIVREIQQIASNVYLLHNPKRLASAARNIGIRHAQGNYVLIVDGHCELTDDQHFANVVAAFRESGADCLGRPQPLRNRAPSLFQQCVAAARMSWLGHNPHSAIFSEQARFVPADNVAVAYRREVFEVVGVFDESFDACEDVDLNTRVRHAGLTCYFTPTIAIAYQARSSLKALAYQMARYGRGRSRLGRKYPSTITLPSIVPPLWLLWLVVGGFASLFSFTLAVLFAVSVIVYAVLVTVESVRVARITHVSFFRLPVVFATIHASFGWGYWKEVFLGSPRFLAPTALVPRSTMSASGS